MATLVVRSPISTAVELFLLLLLPNDEQRDNANKKDSSDKIIPHDGGLLGKKFSNQWSNFTIP